ncbi:MAG: zinc ABC transporter substrate-binding protein [Candidatus Omnitrophica bacterium]|nr:zinc ABC transporter substrate-binding protein [Candidatus Omnitrophota bacterium]
MRFFRCAAVVLGLLLIGQSWPSEAAQKLKVVATMSTFADLAKTIGGEHVDVSYIASPKFNPHFIEPKPSDVVKVKRADLLIHAGLDLELWRGPLLDAAGNRRVMSGGEGELDLSRGIALLDVPAAGATRAQGDIHLYGNPHYWVDPQNGKIIAREIAEKLSAIDSSHANDYEQRLQELVSRLDQSIQQWQQRLTPFHGQALVGYHNEWPYLMRFAGLRMEQFLEPKPGIPPTPRQLEFLRQEMVSHQVRGIVQSSYFPREAAASLAKRTGATVILLCQNVGEVSQASDYIAMLEYNVNQLVRALQTK